MTGGVVVTGLTMVGGAAVLPIGFTKADGSVPVEPTMTGGVDVCCRLVLTGRETKDSVAGMDPNCPGGSTEGGELRSGTGISGKKNNNKEINKNKK